MRINEIFYSIQGEGKYAGYPMVFVRLQGCSMKPPCSWCDTTYAYDPKGGLDMSVEAVYREVERLVSPNKCMVCITGGESLMQVKDCGALVQKLNGGGFSVEIETNGMHTKPFWWESVYSWCVDIKCPSSGWSGKWYGDWLDTRRSDQLKLVVGTLEDLDYASRVISEHGAGKPEILVSPVIHSGYDELTGGECSILNRQWLQIVAEFCKEHRVKFSLQLHKVVWGERKGV